MEKENRLRIEGPRVVLNDPDSHGSVELSPTTSTLEIDLEVPILFRPVNARTKAHPRNAFPGSRFGPGSEQAGLLGTLTGT